MTVNDMIDALTELQESGHGNDVVNMCDDNYGELCSTDTVEYDQCEDCVIVSGS